MGAIVLFAGTNGEAPPPQATTHTWRKLDTVKFPGKQDDIYFVTPEMGWYCNGQGRIYKTRDGGATWVEQVHKPGTFFRCIAFVDSMRGFAGNVGPGYFPNVTDSVPLYETRDGGTSWTPVRKIEGPPVRGLCAIHVDTAPVLYAAGRVGGPSILMISDDGGETWTSRDMTSQCGMILDIQFVDDKTGIISAATTPDAQTSNASILVSRDGGETWAETYRSKRPYEITWMSSFPSPRTGYVTIQSYNPDSTVVARYVAKTEDAGRSWKELHLTDQFKVREFGVGFADEKTGWVGATTTGFETQDGGESWQPVELGKAVNKIRIVEADDGIVGYAIGVDVYKLETGVD